MKHIEPPNSLCVAKAPNSDGSACVRDENGCCIFTARYASDADELVRRWNSHAALVDAVRQVLIASEDCGDMDDIDWTGLRAALALAEGGAA